MAAASDVGLEPQAPGSDIGVGFAKGALRCERTVGQPGWRLAEFVHQKAGERRSHLFSHDIKPLVVNLQNRQKEGAGHQLQTHRRFDNMAERQRLREVLRNLGAVDLLPSDPAVVVVPTDAAILAAFLPQVVVVEPQTAREHEVKGSYRYRAEAERLNVR